MNFEIPQKQSSIIKVIGVGGGGSNAVNQMFEQGIKDVDFVVCNTDSQALAKSPVPIRIQLGQTLTEGRGAGNKPEQGRQAAIEDLDEVIEVLSDNTKMVFITAGMGGGTGTGAAPVIAKAAKDLDILTVAIVTIPFKFEGQIRINQAIEGIANLREHVDALLVINNEKLREIHGNLNLTDAFRNADNILTIAAKGIAEIITVHGYINVDFEDVKTVMRNSGVAVMGSAIADGEGRAIKAIKNALNSPLLNNSDIKGSKNILLNITSGNNEITVDEVGQITDYVEEVVGTTSNIIWGTGSDLSLGDSVCVTIIATGFSTNSIPELYSKEKKNKVVNVLEEDNQVFFNEDKEEEEFVIEEDNDISENILSEYSPDINHEIEKDIIYNELYGNDIKFEVDQHDVTPGNQDRINKLKKHYEKLKEVGQLKTDDEIEKLEKEPAYLRKKIQIDLKPTSSESKVSNLLISNDGNNGTKIRTNNAYLHDNVD